MNGSKISIALEWMCHPCKNATPKSSWAMNWGEKWVPRPDYYYFIIIIIIIVIIMNDVTTVAIYLELYVCQFVTNIGHCMVAAGPLFVR